MLRAGVDRRGHLIPPTAYTHIYAQGYMKAVKAKLAETNPDRVSAFEKGAADYAKKIIGNFKDYEFYTGESMNPDGMVALLNYRVSSHYNTFYPTCSQ